MSIDKTEFEGGKYTIQLECGTGDLKLLRHGEEWENDPKYSKMLIHIMYEVSKLRKIVKQSKELLQEAEANPELLQDHDYFRYMMNIFKEYEDQFNIDLKSVEDINE